MSLVRQIARGLRALMNPSGADRAVSDEVDDYFHAALDSYLAQGMSLEEARYAARVELGSTAAVRQEVRQSGWESWVMSFATDVRYAARGLLASPAFTTIAIMTLAVGMGATTAIFSAVKPVLLQPLNYPNPEELVTLQEFGASGVRADTTFGMYRWLRDRSRVFETIAVARSWQPTLTGTGEPERLEGQRVTAGFFDVFRVRPAIGPGFGTGDDIANGPNVVVLSHALWQRRCGGDQRIVGRSITLDGDTYVVAGVMPEDFRAVLTPSTELWSLLQYDMSQGRAWGHHLTGIGRLRPGITADEAGREINELFQTAIRELQPQTYSARARLEVLPLGAEVTRGVKPLLVTVSAAVALLLIIASANLVNVLIARAIRRRPEFVLRIALGAGSGRLFRLLLAESVLLGTLGGLVGLLLARYGIQTLVALSPPGLPRVEAIRLDSGVFVFSGVVTAVLALIMGAVPFIHAARCHATELLQATRVTSVGSWMLRRALVVGEMAVAVTLLVGSILLFLSVRHLLAVPVGFDTSNLLTLQIQTIGSKWNESGSTTQFFEQVLAAVRGVTGVTSVALTSQLPLGGVRDEYGVRFIADQSVPGDSRGYNSFRYAISPAYLETMRLPVRTGRGFNDDDREGAARVALVSESLARLRFGSIHEAVGEGLQIGGGDTQLYTIVGVVADVRQVSLSLSQAEAVYTTLRQWQTEERVLTLVVRTRHDPEVLAPAVRRAVWSVDGNQPIVRVETMHARLLADAGERRFALMLFSTFALAALILAAAGCYGVLAGYVAERTREIGVRSALGAGRNEIVRLVIVQGLALVGPGVALGLVIACLASTALTTLLFGLTPRDPRAYALAAGLLLVVSVVASGVPAWRASRIDPATTLKIS